MNKKLLALYLAAAGALKYNPQKSVTSTKQSNDAMLAAMRDKRGKKAKRKFNGR